MLNKVYSIDHKTMLFTDIDAALRGQMIEWCKSVVLKGEVPNPDPDWLTHYLRMFGYDNDRQRLLVVSTALPQRILLSLVLDQAK